MLANVAVGRKIADEDGQPRCRRVELARRQDRSPDIGANVEHRAFHRALSQRHQDQAAQIGQRHHDEGSHDHGRGQLTTAETSGRHHHQFAVGIELVQAEQRAGEKGHRQDDDEQLGQDQDREIQKYGCRLAAIDHEVQQPQRLGKPDHARQQESKQRDRTDHLAQHIV